MEDVVKGIGGEYTGNYTGPYWSDGKVQSSVEWGESDPQTQLDALSRMHDSAYAKYPDEKHREAADKIYNDEAQKLAGKFPHLAGNIVLYGNHFLRHPNPFRMVGGGLLGNFGHLASLIYTAAGSIKDANRYYGGQALNKEMREVSDYYKTDPKTTKVVSTRNAINPSHLVSNPKIVPMPKIDELSDPVEAQARKFANYAKLEKEAIKSKTQENTTPLQLLGHRPMSLQKAFRKKKKNKIHLLPIRK
jgi:hypothetical protein